MLSKYVGWGLAVHIYQSTVSMAYYYLYCTHQHPELGACLSQELPWLPRHTQPSRPITGLLAILHTRGPVYTHTHYRPHTENLTIFFFHWNCVCIYFFF